ncbi:amidohydrolase family protein [Streptomyces sp. NPDC051913]|uniref:amidohydrolase family protein n=1 Tax=Streptomyces sp. NPDC051913 TaxID=3365676 RepID=UPI0037CEAD99
MIIDAHAHLNAPAELYAYQASLLSSRGAHGKFGAGVSDTQLREYGEHTLSVMDSVGTDLQLISPRPFSCAHSAQPARIVHWWTDAVNDAIARQVAQFPGRLAGVAGLPQAYGESPEQWASALERAVTEFGMVGCVLNPDPSEGTGYVAPLGDEWWYPLYDKLVELDVPALIHSGGCQNGRETYSEHFITEESIAILSLLNSEVFLRYPTLKIIVAHGGGSVPYQIGRWRAARAHKRLRQGQVLQESFDDSLRRLWFDTVLHHPPALELLLRTVGHDRVLFGTEKPGSGSAPDPRTGRDFDDIRPVIEGFDFLDDKQKQAVLSENALSVFRLLGVGRDS